MRTTPTRHLAHLLTPTLILLACGLFAQPNFINKLPIPPLMDAKDGVIELVIGQKTHLYNPGNPSDSLNGSVNQPNGITTFSYNKKGADTLTLLGPTLYWRQNDSVHIRVTNNLPPGNASGTDSTTTHWHGVELPAQFDGGPHQVIPPGTTWPVDIKVVDYGSTMWYHPHFHNRTLEQVQMGLSGMIIVEEANDALLPYLPRTYGVDDIPVIIGDIGVEKDNQNDVYNLVIRKAKRPFNIVNGVNSPYVHVPRHFVRLRILNGSTRKAIKFGFSKSYSNPADNLLGFKLIATDGGYTTEADDMTSIMSGVGARDEVVIDLRSHAIGDTVYLSNLNESMPHFVVGSPQPAPAPGSGGQDATRGTAFLALVIAGDNAFPSNYQPINEFPNYFVQWEPDLGDTFNIDGCRHKKLTGQSGPGSHFTIDNKPYEMGFINDTICVDTKEVWTIENTTAIAHPFHIHKIQFRILDITDSMNNKLDLMALGLNGPKDDILVWPGWKVRFFANFSDYPNPIEAKFGYMYHCHILTHEDAEGGGMMHQFVVASRPECEASSHPDCETVSTDQPSRQMMVLYPNPASGEFFVRGHSAAASRLRILDLQGRALSTHTLPAFSGEQRVPTAGLPPGLFLVEWRTREGLVIGKVVLR